MNAKNSPDKELRNNEGLSGQDLSQWDNNTNHEYQNKAEQNYKTVCHKKNYYVH